MSGELRTVTAEAGSYDLFVKAVTKAEWSKKIVENGEGAKIIIETAGIEDGNKANVTVWQRTSNRVDIPVEQIDNLVIEGGRVEHEWSYKYPADEPPTDSGIDDKPTKSSPYFYFVVSVAGVSARSPMLEYYDCLEIELKDEDGNPIPEVEYILELSNGEYRKGKLDSEGKSREERVPPGYHRVEFFNHENLVPGE